MTKATVLIPAYNPNLEWLHELIQDLNKQDYNDFSVLFIDDGSKEPLNKDWVHRHLKVPFSIFRTTENLGITSALNRGLSMIDSQFIIRMDADDRMHPQRISRQIKFMESHPEIGACGSGAVRFGRRSHRFPTKEKHRDIMVQLLFENPFCHPTLCFRQSAVKGLEYPSDVQQAEDYLFWSILASKGVQFANIPDILVGYRVSHSNSSSATKAERFERHKAIQASLYRNLFGDKLSPEMLQGIENGTHSCLGYVPCPKGVDVSSRTLHRHVQLVLETVSLQPDLFQDTVYLKARLQKRAAISSSMLATKIKKNFERFFVTGKQNWI
jgi:glycosyltransferase involved in cell wall biosynthesis